MTAAIIEDPRTGGRTGDGCPRLILASRSPRRRALLDEAGVTYEVRLADGVDDSDLEPGAVTPEDWVAALAYLKARAVADTLGPDEDAVVLGADTVCVVGDRIVGKPVDRDHARATIEAFENIEHGVLTGVALVRLGPDGHEADLFVDRARVRVGTIGPERIEAYLDTGQWDGKAGAYNLFDRLDDGWPIEFDGDGTTIVGLPMLALGARLGRLGIVGVGRADGGGG